MGTVFTSFGEFVRENRVRLDITQDELAERVGAARTTISKMEKSPKPPSSDLMVKVLAALGCVVVSNRTGLTLTFEAADQPAAAVTPVKQVKPAEPAKPAGSDKPAKCVILGEEVEINSDDIRVAWRQAGEPPGRFATGELRIEDIIKVELGEKFIIRLDPGTVVVPQEGPVWMDGSLTAEEKEYIVRCIIKLTEMVMEKVSPFVEVPQDGVFGEAQMMMRNMHKAEAVAEAVRYRVWLAELGAVGGEGS